MTEPRLASQPAARAEPPRPASQLATRAEPPGPTTETRPARASALGAEPSPPASQPWSASQPAELKSCCANLYQSEWARLLLGDSFHPGGLALTERLGQLLGLGPDQVVLDIAAGRGTSAIHLARIFGCRVVGVDLGAANVGAASAAATAAGLADRVSFREGDAEALPFADGAFDAAICECAFCTFPDKSAAAAELARVVRPGGRVALADLTRSGELPVELGGLLAWIACIADARPVDEYVGYLRAAGFGEATVERHDEALVAMVAAIRQRLLGAQLMAKLGKLDLPGVDWEQATALARSAAEATRRGQLGYAAIVAARTRLAVR